ncbi:MAG: acyl-CoA thioesterase [Bacteroidota bacterium]|nr:acyl-CoA thioesterase [Bacteroidota bacterium]
MIPINKSRFETVLKVRPDDIDMMQHVHSSRYMDYVLAARFEQMDVFYKMPMEEFIKHGYGWVIKNTFMEFKRPLGLGDEMRIVTFIDEVFKDGVKVNFEIIRNKDNKMACSGYFNYTMVHFDTGKAAIIPEWIIERYAI